MAISIRNPRVEMLARDLSRRTGRSMTEAIEGALEARLAGIGADFESRRAELAGIAAACRALPDLDARSAEEILGYDEAGAFGHGNNHGN